MFQKSLIVILPKNNHSQLCYSQLYKHTIQAKVDWDKSIWSKLYGFILHLYGFF